jgi:anti-sigma-K factor RskA
VTSHDEASGLLGAYALDAVDGDECTALEHHLETCPRCRAELDGLREVAGALGNSVEPPPEGLWSRIALHLPEAREPGDPPPMPRLATGAHASREAPAGAGARRPRVVVAAVGALAVAAAVVALALGIGLVRADDRVSNLQATPSTVAAALRAPGHRLVTLESGPARVELAQVVVVPSGQGYLVSSKLPALGDGRTYQLWAVEEGRPISLGLLGASPGRAAFTMAGSARPARLSITAEPRGGSVVPTGPIVATGTV